MELSADERRRIFGPAVGEPGYLPYCACPGFHRARRGADAFECDRCGLHSRKVNGIDMFDETAPDGPGYDWNRRAGEPQ